MNMVSTFHCGTRRERRDLSTLTLAILVAAIHIPLPHEGLILTILIINQDDDVILDIPELMSQKFMHAEAP